jgi:hypothetical protein
MYLLDTNILSELVKKRPNPQVLSQLRSKAALTLFTSCICLRLSHLQNFLVDQRGDPKGDALFQNRFESRLDFQSLFTHLPFPLFWVPPPQNRCSLNRQQMQGFDLLRREPGRCVLPSNWIPSETGAFRLYPHGH